MIYFRKIGFTLFTKLIIALLNLYVLIITSKILGAEVRGQIGFLLLVLAAGVIIAELIAGPVLVYWTSRVRNSLLLRYSYLWSFFVALAILVPVHFFSLLHGVNSFSIFPLIFFLSIHGCNMQFLLGRERVDYYNLSSLVGPTYMFFVCLLMINQDEFGIHDFVLHLNISYFLSWMFSSIFSFATSGYIPNLQSEKVTFSTILKSGFFNQTSSLFTLGGSRVNFYFLESRSGLAPVGIFSSALTFAEAVLILPSSIALVLVSSLVNKTIEEQDSKMVFIQALVSGLITLFAMIVLMLVPEFIFSEILGKDFTGMNQLFIYLLPGIVCVGIGTVITHYFSANGRYRLNSIISSLGFLVWLLSSYLFSNAGLGMKGAAISFSMGWFFVLTLNIIVFHFFTPLRKRN